MKKAVRQTKWWWWFPIISLFFIEEQVEWTISTMNEKDRYMRTILVTVMLCLHTCALFIIIFNLVFN
jgi:hypothetical protein